jgi:hypothetical protein
VCTVVYCTVSTYCTWIVSPNQSQISAVPPYKRMNEFRGVSVVYTVMWERGAGANWKGFVRSGSGARPLGFLGRRFAKEEVLLISSCPDAKNKWVNE